MRNLFKTIVLFTLLAFSFFIFPQLIFANTTPFRSANIITTDGESPYTNLDNCSVTDGATCNRATAIGFSNLYFRDFGNYDDFGMPEGSKITKVRIRVTGKASIPVFGLFVGLSDGKTFVENCQFPSDIWTLWYLNGQTINTQTFTAGVLKPPGFDNLAYCLRHYNFENKSSIWRINYGNNILWSANIDNFEIAFDYDVVSTPTPTPTPTSTPTPTPIPGPAPFLDLPWDYEGKGLSFDQVAFNPVSWFDHKYPLQDIPCCIQDIMNYTGKRKIFFYKSHNGYDYGLQNGIQLNTPVLAAANGWATFKSWKNSGGAGNVIKIDHGNGYQTWYEHLSTECVLLCEEGKKVFVNKGQVIGKVGMTGNTSGPHIHFSVVKDSNKSDSFEDDIPYGVVDPLGWEGSNTDPWELWTDGNRKGTKSFSLFIPRKASKSTLVPTTGYTLALDAVQIAVPSGALDTDFSLTYNNGPFESVSDTLKSIVPSFFLNAIDTLNQKVTQFLKPIRITYNYANANLFNVNEDTLKLYLFNEQANQWEELLTTLDKDKKIASAETFHFSQFALMGETKDLVAPTTETIISGDMGQNNWYRSDVKVELTAKDNDSGVGLQYTLYTLNDNDWLVYESPLIFDQEGSHKITYQSYDKAENTEERKVIEFNIDKTPPEAKIFIDQDKQAIVVEGIDQNQTTVEKLDNTETKKKDDAIYTISDLAGNTIKLDVRDRDKEKKDRFKIYSTQYNQETPINQPDNHYNVKYKEKKNKLNVSEQNFEIEKEIKIRIKYNNKKNQSTIITRVNGEEKVKDTRDGLTLLQLTTEKGMLRYSY